MATERLTPDSNGTNNNWLDSGFGDVYTNINDIWADRADSTQEIASTGAGQQTEKGFTNPTGMGAGDTCTRIDIDFYGKDGNAGSNAEAQISYNTGGVWEGVKTTGLLASGAEDNYPVFYDSLSLTLTQIQNLQVRLTNIGAVSIVPVCAVLSVVITYETAGGGEEVAGVLPAMSGSLTKKASFHRNLAGEI